jgi:hypothetical protein
MATSGVAFRPEEPNVARMYDYMLGGKDIGRPGLLR